MRRLSMKVSDNYSTLFFPVLNSAELTSIIFTPRCPEHPPRFYTGRFSRESRADIPDELGRVVEQRRVCVVPGQGAPGQVVSVQGGD